MELREETKITTLQISTTVRIMNAIEKYVFTCNITFGTQGRRN
jgi:hypothetical protein